MLAISGKASTSRQDVAPGALAIGLLVLLGTGLFGLARVDDGLGILAHVLHGADQGIALKYGGDRRVFLGGNAGDVGLRVPGLDGQQVAHQGQGESPWAFLSRHVYFNNLLNK